MEKPSTHGRFIASVCLLLLQTFLYPGHASTATTDAKNLHELKDADARAAYCYYSLNIYMQQVARGADRLAALPLLMQAREWKTVHDAYFADPRIASKRMNQALMQFNQWASAEAKSNGGDMRAARAVVAERDATQCKTEMASLQQRLQNGQTAQTPISRPGSTVTTATTRDTAKPAPAPAPAAVPGPWAEPALFGPWQTQQMSANFMYANRIRLVLWNNGKGQAEGLAVFYKPMLNCLGVVKVTDDPQKLRFTPFEGPNCTGLEQGYFSISRQSPNRTLTLGFYPANTTDIRRYPANLFTMRKLPDTPATLQDTSRRLQKNRGSLQQGLASLESARQQRIDAVLARLEGGFQAHFPEARLIGTWRGQFVDKRRSYAAELTFWTGKLRRFNQLLGLVRFEDKLCTTVFLIGSNDKLSHIRMEPSLLRPSSDDCATVTGDGSLQLDADTGKLAMFIQARLGQIDGMATDQCLTNLPNPGLQADCYTVGLFGQAGASATMLDTMARSHWKGVAPPAAKDWAIIQKNAPQLARLQAAHEQALAMNSNIKARIDQEEKALAARREADRSARQQERERRERAEQQARKNRWKAAESRNGQSRTARLGKPAEVYGPFDGLRGASFFNAIYKGDFDSVRQYTRYYQERKIRQRKQAMGNKPHIMDGILDQGVRSIKLTSNFLAVYLFNYDSAYGDCLKKDAVTFEVVKQVPDTVTYNMLGWEISRSYGYTSRKQFRVNKEFVSAFRRVGKMKPTGAMASISDMLLNNGGTDIRREIVAGTLQIMGKFACDSPEIRQLERNILRF